MGAGQSSSIDSGGALGVGSCGCGAMSPPAHIAQAVMSGGSGRSGGGKKRKNAKPKPKKPKKPKKKK